MTDAVAEHLRDADAVVDDFESWKARLALHVIVDEAIADDEIVREMAAEGIRAEDARAAVLGDESVLARVRVEQDQAASAPGAAARPAFRRVPGPRLA